MLISDARVATATTTVHAEGLCSLTLWLVARWVAGEPTILEPNKFVEQRWCTFDEDLPSPLFDVWSDLLESPAYGSLLELVGGDPRPKLTPPQLAR